MANIKVLYAQIVRNKKAEFKRMAVEIDAHPRAAEVKQIIAIFRRRAREDFKSLRSPRLSRRS